MDKIDKLSEIFKLLSDPTRLKIIKLIGKGSSEITLDDCQPNTCTGKGGPLCVNALVNKLEVTQSAVSQHLRVLRQAGIVRGERKGSFIHYSINQEILDEFKVLLQDELGDFLKM
ncbi:MAG: metalloregulator ArsR/SmtB family transcription factor [Proteobacteria bacterium]|nr:metalloregulator ArsR/SmtB family transcription factor [Pseudomonadota bacterium]